MGGGNPQITPTPVPYRKLLPLAVIQFVEAFTFTNIFSYVGFMVWDFHLTDDPDQVGYYAGYLGSVFSVASFLSSFWWGRLSDRWGRRPVLLFGCVGGIISSALFGFSKNLTMALVARFLAGALNGNIGVVKGYAADICDKTNQVKGIGVMQLFWGLGGILGPLFGGVLSRPCQNYKGLCSNDSLFGQFPYLVPNLFSCLVGVIALVLLIICLPKEEPRRQGKKSGNGGHEKIKRGRIFDRRVRSGSRFGSQFRRRKRRAPRKGNQGPRSPFRDKPQTHVYRKDYCKNR